MYIWHVISDFSEVEKDNFHINANIDKLRFYINRGENSVG